jgi:hypothetical protein
MQRATILLLTGILLLVVGCGMKHMAAPATPPPPETLMSYEDDRAQGSLFKGDLAVLSNQEIEKILGSRLVLSDRHRLAVLRFNPKIAWSEDLTDLENQNSEKFLQTLRSSPQLTQVRFVPTLLVPEKQTVPYLREAAARFQADLLLVYTTRVQTFERYRVFHPNQVKARCIVNSLLLDVRTGIVAYSAESGETVTAEKVNGDLNFSETVAKAEAEAMGRALQKVADSTVAYLRESGA